MAVNLEAFGYFAPLLAFLIVFLVVFATLNKTNILGENKWVQLFSSLLVSTIFVSAAGVRDYVITITPWFAALIVSLTFVLMIIGFGGKVPEGLSKGVGIGFVVALLLIFLISAFVVFSESILPYLPGSTGEGADPGFFILTRELYQTRFFGAVLLIGISAVVSWVLVKSGGKK